jgi:SAM-dependent methyltransferase
MNLEVAPPGKHEQLRLRYFDRVLAWRGASVLDIGANTGYFTFAAIERGARSVCAVEGNASHAQFIAEAARALGLEARVQVRHEYFDFAADGEVYDIALCLNVLHHLGGDFGDAALSFGAARRQMLDCTRRMATRARTLVLQLGFNWKGDRCSPLFEGGRKAALIDFVREGVAREWTLAEAVSPNPHTLAYEPACEANLGRFDLLGEFLNRPILLLRSRLI